MVSRRAWRQSAKGESDARLVIRFLTLAPDTTISVQPLTWTGAKALYR